MTGGFWTFVNFVSCHDEKTLCLFDHLYLSFMVQIFLPIKSFFTLPSWCGSSLVLTRLPSYFKAFSSSKRPADTHPHDYSSRAQSWWQLKFLCRLPMPIKILPRDRGRDRGPIRHDFISNFSKFSRYLHHVWKRKDICSTLPLLAFRLITISIHYWSFCTKVSAHRQLVVPWDTALGLIHFSWRQHYSWKNLIRHGNVETHYPVQQGINRRVLWHRGMCCIAYCGLKSKDNQPVNSLRTCSSNKNPHFHSLGVCLGSSENSTPCGRYFLADL